MAPTDPIEIKAEGTVGISPKVLLPLLSGLLVGVILLIAGEHDVGVTVLLASVGLGGVGAGAGAGKVKAKI